MRKNRSEIDEFLIKLDSFIWEYIESINPVILSFFLKWNRNNFSSIQQWVNHIDIPNLVNLINLPWWIHRTDKFVRKIAYRQEYKKVKDVSFEHILIKFLYLNWEYLENTFIFENILENKLLDYDLKEFMIPKDWEHNNDLIIYKK